MGSLLEKFLVFLSEYLLINIKIVHRTLVLYDPVLLGLQDRSIFFHMVGNRDVGEIIIYGRNEILCVYWRI